MISNLLDHLTRLNPAEPSAPPLPGAGRPDAVGSFNDYLQRARPPETPSDDRAAPAGRETPSPTDRASDGPPASTDDRPEASPATTQPQDAAEQPAPKDENDGQETQDGTPDASRKSAVEHDDDPDAESDEKKETGKEEDSPGVVLDLRDGLHVEPAAEMLLDAAEPEAAASGQSASAKGNSPQPEGKGDPKAASPVGQLAMDAELTSPADLLAEIETAKATAGSAIATAARSTAKPPSRAARSRLEENKGKAQAARLGEEPTGAAASHDGSPTVQDPNRLGAASPPATVTESGHIEPLHHDGRAAAGNETVAEPLAATAATPAESRRPAEVAAAAVPDRLAAPDEGSGPLDSRPGPHDAIRRPGDLAPAVGGPSSAPGRRAAGARHSPDGADASRVDRARFVQRVERAFHSANDHGGSLRLRLSPPELGSLRVEIAVRHGAMTARVEAETPAAKNLLLDNLPALRERLAQQDIKIERFEVDLMDRGLGGSSGQAQYTESGEGDGGRAGRSAAHRPPTAEASAASTESAPAPRWGEGGRLNVVI